MKQIRSIVSACIALLVFTACTDDDQVSYALQNISAPTQVEAVFDIAQDESGTVTVTPTAVGANSFQVTFGDAEGETPTEVSPGETVSHVYGEGTFNLRIVAVGATGLTSELVRVITISFTPPSNLAVDIAVSDQNPFQIEVAPTADNVTVFDIYYGDVADEVPQTILAGETGTHIYAEAGDYTVRVVARGAGSATVEYSEVVTIAGASDPMSLPITFDIPTVNYAFATFNGASYEVVDNPDPSGANPEVTKVGAITNSGANWEGGAFNLGTPVDFSGTNKTIFMKMWSNVAVPVLMKFEGGVNGERQNEVSVNHGGTGWELLSFDFANDAVKSYIDGTQGVGEPFVPTGQYATMVLFIDGPGTTAGTFYIDDIEQEASLVAPQLPIDFEGSGFDYTWNGFGSSSFGPIPAGVIANPDATGINTSGSVVRITKEGGAQVWAGASMNLAGAIDFSGGTTLSVKVWSPRAGTAILLKLEDSTSPPDGNGNPTVFAEVQATSTVAGGWEALSFDLTTFGGFSTSNSYDRVILFPDFGNAGQGEDFYFDDIEIAVVTPQAPQLPIDFEGANIDYTWNGFGSSSFGPIPAGVIANPDASGINTSGNVVQITKPAGAQVWAGASLNLAGAIDFTGGTTITVKVWSPRAGTAILLKLEDSTSPPDGNGNPTVFAEVQAASTVAGAWEELSFDLTTFGGFSTGNSYDRVILFPDFGNAGQGEDFYFDDIIIP